MDFPADVALLLERLRETLTARAELTGIYLYGSLTRQIMRRGVRRLSEGQASGKRVRRHAPWSVR